MRIFYPDGTAETRRPVRAGAATRAGANASVWFDAVQRLIDHGHRLPDILDYTLAQVRGFLHATGLQEAASDARLLSLIAIGTRGDARNLEQTMDKLTDCSASR